ncbi:MAG: hypothetical protein B6241_07540 [Spirochaetaceae bacterium 4572_59]|nr:MAG: hypothetical protein B6241_07540 [Spirochaetaceae bacterium 4572_59]
MNQYHYEYKSGLGIDAGGTYTDAVLYDFTDSCVRAKAKALTTKWRYSKGIMEAVAKMPAARLATVDLVCLSTTLVTNAIVESNTYPVGLFIMPPGKMEEAEIHNRPTEIIKGRMTIEGVPVEPVDPEEIRIKAEAMVSRYGVRAFAVSGYGGSVNPSLELEVKNIIRECTGLNVCCGHELSGTLNFIIRARTAVLNAGTIPIMEEFLKEMETVLAEVGIKAPLLVVRGDGSIMTGDYARDFPVQTALSGPAASMAGARHLTGLKNAIVADVGGTTTDIGFLEDYSVSICDEGADIARWKTHVRAVDMHTIGLGGDSEISFKRREWAIGPRRITPFCCLSSQYALDESLDAYEKNSSFSEESLTPLQWLFVTGKVPDFELTYREDAVMNLLKERPMMIGEIADLLTGGVWKILKFDRLEKSYCLQRSGLTPTDLFHLKGQICLWKSDSLNRYFSLIARYAAMGSETLLDKLSYKVSRTVEEALLKRVFSGLSSGDINPLMQKGNRWMAVHTKIDVPLIGLGAPAALMLNEAVSRLGGQIIIPRDAAVANALGAVTSQVSVSSRASIIPTIQGLFRIQGLKHTLDDFETLERAEQSCLSILKKHIRAKAQRAGTSSKKVIIQEEHKTAEAAGGDIIFLEKLYFATLKGLPDLV